MLTVLDDNKLGVSNITNVVRLRIQTSRGGTTSAVILECGEEDPILAIYAGPNSEKVFLFTGIKVEEGKPLTSFVNGFIKGDKKDSFFFELAKSDD